MKRSSRIPIAVMLAGATSVLALTAHAGSARIVMDGSGTTLDVQGSFISVGSSSGSALSGGQLTDIHRAIHADGVATDGLVTLLLADTERGLSFLTLIDDNSIGGDADVAQFDAQIGMTSSAPASAAFLINDRLDDVELTSRRQDLTGESRSDDDRKVLDGVHTWKSTKRGDAQVWTGLAAGNALDFNFTAGGDLFSCFPGLDGAASFQFLTQRDGRWMVLHRESFSDGGGEGGTFGFSMIITASVVPAPTAALFGIAGLLCVAGTGRRRRA